MNKHGLVSAHASKHSRRGGIDEATLRAFVEDGQSLRQIAEQTGLSPTAIRYWLKRYGLRTAPNHYMVGEGEKPEQIMRECRRHGWIAHQRGAGGFFRCGTCAAERVSERRRRVKAILIAEAGGVCIICGYQRCQAALQFHHVDPAQKSFHISLNGATRAIDALREEAAKCVLLCANCHAEVEVGDATLPPAPPDHPG
jgi:ferredoxin